MNFELSKLPHRSSKPRENGLTMVMDKGLSYREAEDILSVGEPYIDFIKLGFGTSYVTPHLDRKIKLYQDAGFGCLSGWNLAGSVYNSRSVQ
jgi:phosphosulfolactate synthase